jgi:hypothetical protein
MASSSKSVADRLNVRQCCKYLGALAEPERLWIVQALLGGRSRWGRLAGRWGRRCRTRRIISGS